MTEKIWSRNWKVNYDAVEKSQKLSRKRSTSDCSPTVSTSLQIRSISVQCCTLTLEACLPSHYIWDYLFSHADSQKKRNNREPCENFKTLKLLWIQCKQKSDRLEKRLCFCWHQKTEPFLTWISGNRSGWKPLNVQGYSWDISWLKCCPRTTAVAYLANFQHWRALYGLQGSTAPDRFVDSSAI